MELGAFSISLSVKDIKASKTFYMKLGFSIVGGVEDQKWLILRNGAHTIGLFQDMFERNSLTFNPGWDSNADQLNDFSDVRELREHFKDQGLEILGNTEENSTGPASFMLMDPDGNPIIFDQHV